MTDAIHEQLSAFLDGELSAAESELLLKRVERDPELSARLKRHMLIGDALRATHAEGPSRGFSSRVSEAVEAESLPARARWVASQWLKPVAGGAIAAGVAAMVLVSLRTQPTTAGVQMAGVAPAEEIAMPVNSAASVEARVASQVNVQVTDGSDRFVVPAPSSNRIAPPIRVMNQGQLANYVVAHSEYSSPLGRRNVLTGLLAEEVDADQADYFLLEDAEREALQNELAKERLAKERAAAANKPVARQNEARAAPAGR